MKNFKIKTLVAATSIFTLFASMNSCFANQALVDRLSDLHLNYSIEDNRAGEHGVDCAALGADGASCSTAVIRLTNQGEAISGTDWAIYFHSIHRILHTGNDQFRITRITGDLHKIEPTEAFNGFPARESVAIPVTKEYRQLFESDVLPRWYAVSGEAQPKILKNTDTEDLHQFITPLKGDQWKRAATDNNKLMVPNSRFIANKLMDTLPQKALRGQIVPTPLEVKIHPGNVSLDGGVSLELSALPVPAQQAIKTRFTTLGVAQRDEGYPVTTLIASNLFTGSHAVSGAYRLNITDTQAEVIGFDAAGVFYGLQSILSLLPAEGPLTLAQLEVKDAPRFAYRGMFLDVGRNFHSKQAVLRMLDQMAAYKLNKFHFHLSDDEGWRIEIPGLPELTEIGSQRCHDLSENRCLLPQLGSGPNQDNNGSGYFSRQDYIDILKYAQARQIEVIPEIDMPAHARAAVMSMEARYRKLHHAGLEEEANAYRLLDPTDTSNTTGVQFYDRHGYLNPCMASSQRFVDKVIGEMAKMHNEAGQPLNTWHFGGDEAKNIFFGAGYQDKNAPAKPGKGRIDLSIEDKPWARSAHCQRLIKEGKVADIEHMTSYFAREVSQIVNAHGINKMQAWQDGLKDATDAQAFATQRVGVNFWDTLYWGGFDTVNDWANKGYDVVISSPDYVYFDFPYEVNPQEKGYYWGTRFSDEAKIFSFAPDNLPQNAETSVDRDGNIFKAVSHKPWPGSFGLSGQLWSEIVRTDDRMEYMIYPRMLPLAERAWHRAAWEQDYQAGREYQRGKTHFVDTNALQRDWLRFANLLGQRELAKLDKFGIGYRLPVPGAHIVNGYLEANISLPGLQIEYSTDGGARWQPYHVGHKVKAAGTVSVRSVSPDGLRHSRAENVN